jgi:hypothetical protein
MPEKHDKLMLLGCLNLKMAKEQLENIFIPECMDEEGNIAPTMKVKDGSLYCVHYEHDFCPYRDDKNRLKMYCNFYKHQSIIIGSEYDWNI